MDTLESECETDPIGWKRLVCSGGCSGGGGGFDRRSGVLSGEAGMLFLPLGGLTPGYMILMRDGEGDGAREEKVLETLEAGLMSQFWRNSNSSNLEGPPSETSANVLQREK